MLEAHGILDLADALRGFDVAAALAAELDLLLTVDSTPAHLGGAIETPT